MLVLRDPGLASHIANPDIRALVEQRFRQVCAGEPYDYDRHGYMIVVEPGDTVDALEQEINLPILHSLFEGIHFGDPDHTPSFEILEEHHGLFYEMLFITSDAGFSITVWIPKAQGIPADLLALCAQFATPALSTP